MKIHEFKAFPNPLRVRMFLAEKGINGIPFEQINVPEGEHREPAYLAKNPYGAVPTLELDDGACISETIAICRYFEELQPEPALMGETPREKADIEMWQRRVEQTLNDTVATYFHHGTPGLGSLESYQNKEWGEQNLKRYHDAMQRLDDHLEGRTFMCGETFSIADITLFSGLYLGGILEIEIPDRLTNLNRWRKVVSSRPSASA